MGASGFVRASSMHHFEWCANVVHTFWPVTTYSSPSSTARVFSDARSRARLGLARSPGTTSRRRDRIGARKRAFWSSVPCAITVGPPIVSPSTLAICGARERANSSNRIACSICVAPGAAVLRRPGQAGPAALVELALPVAAELEATPRRPPAPARVVVRDPRAQRVAELLLGRRKRQVHAAETNTLSRARATARARHRSARRAWAARRSRRRPGSARGPPIAATVIASSRKMRAVEQRDARREVGDERGARRADRRRSARRR